MNYFRIVRNKLMGQSLAHWSARDRWTTVLGLLLIILIALPSLQSRNGFGGLIVMAGGAVLFALLLRMNNGYARVYEEIGIRRKHVAKMRAAAKRASAHDPPTPSEHDEFKPPFRQDVIEAVDETGTKQRIPILSQLDPDLPYDYVYVKVRGGSFVGGDNAAQAEAVRELAKIADMTLLLSDLNAGISPLYVPYPHDIHEEFAYYEKNGNPLLTEPESFIITDPAQALLIQRLREDISTEEEKVQAYSMAGDWCLFVITIARDKTTASLFQGESVAEDKVYNLPVLQLARGFVSRLQASPILGYTEVSIVPEHELCILVRQAWDVVGIHDFYKTIAPYRRALRDGLISEEELADILWSQIGCLPKTPLQSPKPEHMVVDGNYISVIRTEGLPEVTYPSTENSLLRLSGNGAWLRQASVGVSSSAAAERTRLYGKKATNANLVSAFLSWLTIVPDFVESSQQELAEQALELKQIPLVQRYERYVALVAPSEAVLRTARDHYIGTVKGLTYKPEIVKLASLHQAKLFAAILGFQS